MKTKSKLKNVKKVKSKNKTLKKSNKTISCNEFCKNFYVYEIDKDNKKFAESANITYKPRKKDRDFRMSSCKKNFCNKDCKTNYKYSDKESEQLFKKNIKNNFITNMKPKLIDIMKSKGAISYCDGFIYNPYNKNNL
jgi:hypothetical protein